MGGSWAGSAGGATTTRFCGLLSQLLRPGRRKAVVLLLPLHLDTARPLVQRILYFQQNALTVFPPLMVPKPQDLNVLGRKEGFARGVR